MPNFKAKVEAITTELAELLVAKNIKYGNSALEPVRVFSKASPTEQLLVRLDDKLSRLRTQSITEDEDVLQDLLGYLVLLKISMDATPDSGYEVSEEVVEPTECLLNKHFALSDSWSQQLIKEEKVGLTATIADMLLGEIFEVEFSQTDSDGNITVKGMDLTIPFSIIKEV